MSIFQSQTQLECLTKKQQDKEQKELSDTSDEAEDKTLRQKNSAVKTAPFV